MNSILNNSEKRSLPITVPDYRYIHQVKLYFFRLAVNL